MDEEWYQRASERLAWLLSRSKVAWPAPSCCTSAAVLHCVCSASLQPALARWERGKTCWGREYIRHGRSFLSRLAKAIGIFVLLEILFFSALPPEHCPRLFSLLGNLLDLGLTVCVRVRLNETSPGNISTGSVIHPKDPKMPRCRLCSRGLI